VSGYRNILVAVAPRAERSVALERATALALRDGARLMVVSATGSPPPFIWLVPGLPENPHDALQHACEERLRSLAETLPRGISVTTRLHRGSPASAVWEELRRATYDLVVIGSHERRRRRWRHGLSRTLLRRSPVSILVVTPDHATAVRVAPRTDDLVPRAA
jgi:nucleotide-binding universal stress UspA family protein